MTTILFMVLGKASLMSDTVLVYHVGAGKITFERITSHAELYE
jgi:mRNA-degrading endonuclease YafQ of YafQ-DinJ toxin-antitoxin module